MQQLETQVQDVCQVVNMVMCRQESPLLPAHPREDSVGEGLTSLTSSCCSWACRLVPTRQVWALTQHVSCSSADSVPIQGECGYGSPPTTSGGSADAARAQCQGSAPGEPAWM